jgi:hypothetical protein
MSVKKSLSFPDELFQAMEARRKRLGLKLSQYVQLALRQDLRDQPDLKLGENDVPIEPPPPSSRSSFAEIAPQKPAPRQRRKRN